MEEAEWSFYRRQCQLWAGKLKEHLDLPKLPNPCSKPALECLQSVQKLLCMKGWWSSQRKVELLAVGLGQPLGFAVLKGFGSPGRCPGLGNGNKQGNTWEGGTTNQGLGIHFWIHKAANHLGCRMGCRSAQGDEGRACSPSWWWDFQRCSVSASESHPQSSCRDSLQEEKLCPSLCKGKVPPLTHGHLSQLCRDCTASTGLLPTAPHWHHQIIPSYLSLNKANFSWIKVQTPRRSQPNHLDDLKGTF